MGDMERTRPALVVVDAVALDDLLDMAERALPQLDDLQRDCLLGSIAEVRARLVAEP